MCNSTDTTIKNRLYIVLLCGGQSKRMGYDKSQVCYHNGITQREYLYQMCNDLSYPVIFSINETQKNDAYYADKTVVVDTYTEAGPMGGICSVFEHYKTALLVLACDMPKLTAHIITNLMRKRKKNYDATVYCSDTILQPLCAIYEYSVLSIMHNALLHNHGSLTQLLQKQKTYIITENNQYFLNINRQGDYNA